MSKKITTTRFIKITIVLIGILFTGLTSYAGSWSTNYTFGTGTGLVGTCINLNGIVPAGASNIYVTLTMTGADLDLYIRNSTACPDLSNYNNSSTASGTTTESIGAYSFCDGVLDRTIRINKYGNAAATATLSITWNDPVSDPGFGNNLWNVAAYNAGAYDAGNYLNLSGVSFRGYYTHNTLNINTNVWGATVSPSSASGYQGCPVTNNNHVFVYKRLGFPAGCYSISNIQYDDALRIYVNGAQVYQNTTCCGMTGTAWLGYLDATSSVEIRVAENTGDSYLRLNFDAGSISTTASYDPTVCSGSNIQLNSVTTLTPTPGTPSAITYAWTGTPIVSGSATANPIVNPSSSTTYTLNVNYNGCTATSNVVVNPLIITGGGVTVCTGATIDLNAPGEWTSWPTGGVRTPVTGSTTNEFYHTFGTVGTENFVTPSGQSIQNARILAIAGGGGGGGGRGGGGGAGGLVHQASITIPAGTHAVVVGNGGNGSAPGAQGNDGANTTITALSINAVGGGGGGSHNTGTTALNSGRNGGSGGGAGMNYGSSNWTAGTGIAGQGSAGQRSGNNGNTPRNTGGGGGAGGAGIAGLGGNAAWSTGTKPNGGPGLANNITGTSITYAGGGAGARGGNDFPGAGGGTGGAGGGGNGEYLTPGSPATAGQTNTGGGGGGSEGTGANGGSGVVIIRYRAPKWEITGGTATAGASIDPITGVLTTGSSSGTIIITYMNEYGCSTNTTITVAAPTATLSTCPSNITTPVNTSTCTGQASWSTPTSSISCPPTVSGANFVGTHNGNYYFHVPTALTWPNAMTDAQTKGGRLVTIENAAENTFLANYMTANGIGTAWIGYSDDATEGNYVSVTGVPLTYGNTPSVEAYNVYNNWNPAEPNDAGGEDYASITSGGGWNDLGGAASNGYFLEFGAFQTSGFANGASNFPIGTTTVTYQVITPGGTANCSFTVTVNGAPSATLTTASGNYCHGNTVTLGGSVTATGAWTLALSNGSTTTGSGNGTWSIPVTPTATTTYSISSLTSACPATVSGSTTITLPTAGATLATNGESATCVINANETVHFYNTTSGRYIASVTAGTNALGSTTATAYVDGAVQLVPACNNAGYETAVMQRHWVINPASNQSATVRLPYTSLELSILATASGTSSSPDDLVTDPNQNTVFMSKYSGPANVNASATDNCPALGGNGGITVHSNSATGSTPVTGVTALYSDFAIPGFSEFWLHGNTFSTPLAVQLANLSANCTDTKTIITWSTASEQNSDFYTLERSRDGFNWQVVATVEGAGTSNTVNSYQVNDNVFGELYYRLKQTDFDGKSESFGPIITNCEGKNELIVYPNPNTGQFTVAVYAAEEMGDATISIQDVTGKAVVSQNINVLSGTNTVYFENTNLIRGTYIVSVLGKDKGTFTPVKLIIQ